MNGLQLAEEINKINENTKIVFVTGYRDYAYEAFKVRAYDYLLKPFNKEDIAEIFRRVNKKDIYIKTSGHFEVLINGVPIKFKTIKSKELLAILVHTKDSYLTSEYIITYLWPNREYDEKVKNLYRRALKDLRDVLIDNNIENILMDFRNQRAVNVAEFRSDPYDIANYMIGVKVTVTWRNSKLKLFCR